jgi:hypothetical protein
MLTSSESVADILDTCLERLRRGESLDVCLRDYPAEAQELAELLNAAIAVRSLPSPVLAPATRSAIRDQLRRTVVNQRAAQRAAQRSIKTRWFFQATLRFALVALLIMVVGLGGGVAAAQRSLPGDPLYRLKGVSERTRLLLATSPEQRGALHLDFAGARSVEILALTSEQRPLNSAVVDAFAQEYQLAWVEIERSPEAASAALRKRYAVSSRADIAVLSATLAHAPGANRALLATAVRFGEQALSRATSTEAPQSPPRSAATPQPPDSQNPNADHPPGNGQSGANEGQGGGGNGGNANSGSNGNGGNGGNANGGSNGNSDNGTNGNGGNGGNANSGTNGNDGNANGGTNGNSDNGTNGNGGNTNGGGNSNANGGGNGNSQDPTPAPHATPGASKDNQDTPAPGQSNGNGNGKKP